MDTKVRKDGKFSEEQLSRILSAHSGKQLEKYGNYWDTGHNISCINQAAYFEPNKFRAVKLNERAAWWFDSNYRKDWTVDQFLSHLIALGVA